MSWRPEVMVQGETKWCGNALRFATREEAEANARDLMFRWTSVNEVRAVESEDPVNRRWEDGRTIKVTEADAVEGGAS